MLQNENDQWIMSEPEIKHLIKSFFEALYTADQIGDGREQSINPGIQQFPALKPEEIVQLEQEFTVNDVWDMPLG